MSNAIRGIQIDYRLPLILMAVILTAWLGTGHPSYPTSDCGNNQWLTLTRGALDPLCVKGVLPDQVVSDEYQKALKEYRRAHAFDPDSVMGIRVDPPMNLIDEVIAALTKGWGK